ncbi:hypothetical protein AA313_de0207289 [Arthrobotrys entomopaga]|nr:hypothetical protein AA313_de0207289 [Arthrobotrys entomopaga]
MAEDTNSSGNGPIKRQDPERWDTTGEPDPKKLKEDFSNQTDSASEETQTASEKEGILPPLTGQRLVPKGYSMNPPPTDRAVRVYADGVFDLFHLGHMRQLEQAKKTFPDTYLLVGIPNDIETHKRKGLTVLADKERAETLRHCKWVDEVIEDAPWIVTPDFLENHAIDYVAHDDEPYAGADTDDIYKPCKEAGKFLETNKHQEIRETDSASAEYKVQPSEKPGVIYLGRIPHGFYEDEMQSYFSQFGAIDRLRLCRNKTTGKSKHYAFIRFKSSEVASIVAETMNNYMLYGHILKCKLLPDTECNERMWMGANRKWKVSPLNKIRRIKHERKRHPQVWDKLQKKEDFRRQRKTKKWTDSGIGYSLGTSLD